MTTEDASLQNDDAKSATSTRINSETGPATSAAADAANPPSAAAPDGASSATQPVAGRQAEYGGPKGLEPTRYGDWERNGRCCDF